MAAADRLCVSGHHLCISWKDVLGWWHGCTPLNGPEVAGKDEIEACQPNTAYAYPKITGGRLACYEFASAEVCKSNVVTKAGCVAVHLIDAEQVAACAHGDTDGGGHRRCGCTARDNLNGVETKHPGRLLVYMCAYWTPNRGL
jgi:hypothetical protein